MKNKIKLLILPALSFLLLSCSNNVEEKETDSTTPEQSENTNTNQNSENGSENTNENNTPVDNTPEDNPVVETKLNPMDEPYIGRQYYLNHIGNIYSAWGTYRGKGITIAVIDAGFNPNHEDFFYKDGTNKVSEKSASFTTSGNTTTTNVGINYVVNMGESHGTFCAGVAAAAVNGKGVAGIAPDASLLLLKTDCKPKSIAKAFKYAADNGAKVVTISIGSYYTYEGDLVNDGSDLGTVFDEPVAYCYNKNIPVISAGGNGGGYMPTEFTFPGCVDHVIGVGGLAANSSTNIWEGSSYNSSPSYQFIDVFAPSDMMYGCCHYDNKIYDGGWNGTSFASPIVAGLAALYFEKNPNKAAAQFETDLYNSCHALAAQNGVQANQLGHGRVDVGKLLGLTSNRSVTAKFKSSWTDCYAYVWNSVSRTQLNNWPGTKLSKNNGEFTINIDISKYDSVIFTKTISGPKTPDLLVSSFINGDVYDLTSPISEQGMDFQVGVYR